MPANGQNPSAWFEQKVNQMTRRAIRATEEAAERGEEITKYHIETRGTAKSGKRGRIETGQMRDSVTHATEKRTIDEVVTRFGYDNGPYWTKFQEQGTKTIEPMYALVDAAEEVVADWREDIAKVVRDA